MSSTNVLTASLLAFSIVGTTAPVSAQSQGYDSFRTKTGQALTNRPTKESGDGTKATDFSFSSRSDSLNWAKWKKEAEKSQGFRVVVSLQERRLWVVIDEDTLLSAPAAVASGQTLSYQGYKKTFDMPRGTRYVQAKDADPIWTPPDW